jgi:DHA1 family tetracycline resistance protein-like MFS transporter
MTVEPAASGPRPAAVAFVLVTVLLDVMALGLVIPVLPKLVEDMAGSTQQAALVLGVFGTLWALMQLLFSPVLGALSDAYGRRPVLLGSSLGLGLDYVLMALAPDLVWLLVGRVISGIMAATFATAGAYIADVTPPAERAARFGLIGAAFGAGFVLGPAIGGLLGAYDPRLPFWVAAGLSLAAAAYGWLVLPESLPPERRSPFIWRSASPLGALRLLRSDPRLLGLSSAMFLYHVAHAVFPAVFVLHAGYRFGWGPGTVGLALAVFGVCSGIVQGALVKPAVRRLGERTMLLVGMACGILGLAALAFAPNVTVFWAGMLSICLWGFIGPSAQGLMTRLVGGEQQGRLQGAGAGLMGVANLIGPSLFTGSFALGIAPALGGPMPGAPYLVAAVCLMLALAVAGRATAGMGSESPTEPRSIS